MDTHYQRFFDSDDYTPLTVEEKVKKLEGHPRVANRQDANFMAE